MYLLQSLPFQAIGFQDIAWDLSIDAEAAPLKKTPHICNLEKTQSINCDNENAGPKKENNIIEMNRMHRIMDEIISVNQIN